MARRRARIDWLSLALGAAAGAIAVKLYVESHKSELVQQALTEKIQKALAPTKDGT